MGTVDLANDLGCDPQAISPPQTLSYHLQRVLCAARAAGVAALDGVCTDLEDHDSFSFRVCAGGESSALTARRLSTPSGSRALTMRSRLPRRRRIERAIIAAHSEAEASGAGVTVVDGKLVEALHEKCRARTEAGVV